MKILVVGGAGYIGSHVTRALLDKGHRVTVFDNLSTGCRENLFAEAAFVQGDILEYPFLKATMEQGFDGLIHLAALKAAGESMTEPEKYSTNNITGTINILNAATACKVKRFVFSSTAAVYGQPQYLPMDEAHPTIPENYYGFTKLEIERILSWYDKLKGLRSAVLRYFNAAGYDTQGRCKGLERNPANLLPVVMEVAAGMRKNLLVFGNDYDTRDGTGLRDYVHVSDLADAHCRALEYIDTNDASLTVNLGSESGITVLEMVAQARIITGKPIAMQMVERRAGDPAVVLASSAYAKKILGWEAKKSDVTTLIQSTWDVYRRTQGI